MFYKIDPSDKSVPRRSKKWFQIEAEIKLVAQEWKSLFFFLPPPSFKIAMMDGEKAIVCRGLGGLVGSL